MFIGIQKTSRDYHDPRQYTAKVTYGAEAAHPGFIYFIMQGPTLFGIGRVTEVAKNLEGAEITFILTQNVNKHVKQFAESNYRAQTTDTNPGTYADSAGTGYDTSTMDAATAIMNGLDRSPDEIARRGRPQPGPTIGQMMGWGSPSDEDDW